MTVWNDQRYTQHLAQANWMANTAVLMHLNERATGDPARDWLSSWAHRYFVGDALRVLVLGCGEGWLERAVAKWPFVSDIDAVDFAADAVARARESAQGIEKIEYGVVDLNRDELPRDAYDVVIAHSVLHHVENLEHAYAQIERAMRANATFVMNEYVGPKRFQFSDRVLFIINALLRCLPSELRQPYETRTRPTVAEMIANDPTEAVRSDELLTFTECHFDVLERKLIGGTILQHLLYDIVQNFRFEVPRERGLLEMLCTIEAMLIDMGRIPCDFVLVAARKRGSRVRAMKRPLPPRAEGAGDVEADPLSRGTDRTDRTYRTDRAIPRRVALRMARVAIASQQPRRANLFEERAIHGWRRPPLPDDPLFVKLIETAATLAAE